MAELDILRPAKIEKETSLREDGSNQGGLCHVAAAAADDDDDDDDGGGGDHHHHYHEFMK